MFATRRRATVAESNDVQLDRAVRRGCGRARGCVRTRSTYLVVDEAGQLALADALASANSARNLILLGDPLQLESGVPSRTSRRVGRERARAHLGRARDHCPSDEGSSSPRPDGCTPTSVDSSRIRSTRVGSRVTRRCAQQTHRVRYGTALAASARHEDRVTESRRGVDIVGGRPDRQDAGTPVDESRRRDARRSTRRGLHGRGALQRPGTTPAPALDAHAGSPARSRSGRSTSSRDAKRRSSSSR